MLTRRLSKAPITMPGDTPHLPHHEEHEEHMQAAGHTAGIASDESSFTQPHDLSHNSSPRPTYTPSMEPHGEEDVQVDVIGDMPAGLSGPRKKKRNHRHNRYKQHDEALHLQSMTRERSAAMQEHVAVEVAVEDGEIEADRHRRHFGLPALLQHHADRRGRHAARDNEAQMEAQTADQRTFHTADPEGSSNEGLPIEETRDDSHKSESVDRPAQSRDSTLSGRPTSSSEGEVFGRAADNDKLPGPMHILSNGSGESGGVAGGVEGRGRQRRRSTHPASLVASHAAPPKLVNGQMLDVSQETVPVSQHKRLSSAQALNQALKTLSHSYAPEHTMSFEQGSAPPGHHGRLSAPALPAIREGHALSTEAARNHERAHGASLGAKAHRHRSIASEGLALGRHITRKLQKAVLPTRKHKKRLPTEKEQLRTARKHFLVSCRSIYWELFEAGFLHRDAVTLLINATEEAEEACDDPDQKLNDWGETLEYVVKPPLLLRLLSKLRLPGFLDTLRLNLTHVLAVQHASLSVNMADAFTAAHRKVLGDLGGSLSDIFARHELVSQLAQESQENVNAARMVIRCFSAEVISAVRSRHAASLLLTYQEKFIRERQKHGVLTLLEGQHLLKHVQARRARIVLRNVYFSFPEPLIVLAWSRLFAHTHPKTRRQFCNILRFRNIERDEVLLSKGQPADGMYVIVRGFACFTVMSADGEMRKVDYLGPGRTMGAIELVSGGSVPITICGASDDLVVAFFPAAEMWELLPRYPSVQRNVFCMASFQLAYLKRRRLFGEAGHTIPQARNIAQAPFGVQEDIWPYIHAGTIQRVHTGDLLRIETAGLVLRGTFLKLPEGNLSAGQFHYVSSQANFVQPASHRPQSPTSQVTDDVHHHDEDGSGGDRTTLSQEPARSHVRFSVGALHTSDDDDADPEPETLAENASQPRVAAADTEEPTRVQGREVGEQTVAMADTAAKMAGAAVIRAAEDAAKGGRSPPHEGHVDVRLTDTTAHGEMRRRPRRAPPLRAVASDSFDHSGIMSLAEEEMKVPALSKGATKDNERRRSSKSRSHSSSSRRGSTSAIGSPPESTDSLKTPGSSGADQRRGIFARVLSRDTTLKKKVIDEPANDEHGSDDDSSDTTSDYHGAEDARRGHDKPNQAGQSSEDDEDSDEDVSRKAMEKAAMDALPKLSVLDTGQRPPAELLRQTLSPSASLTKKRADSPSTGGYSPTSSMSNLHELGIYQVLPHGVYEVRQSEAGIGPPCAFAFVLGTAAVSVSLMGRWRKGRAINTGLSFK